MKFKKKNFFYERYLIDVYKILIHIFYTVIATYREPVRGWIDNVYGPTGLVVGAGTGVLHTYFGNSDVITDMIPVDMVVNALICATKETATNR